MWKARKPRRLRYTAHVIESPKRRWLQISLSTAFVMTLVAALLLWPNVNFVPDNMNAYGNADHYWERGWPFRMNEANYWWEPRLDWIDDRWSAWWHDYRLAYKVDSSPRIKVKPQGIAGTWYLSGVILNSLVAIGILVAVAFICEWLIRRREARKP